MTILLAYTLGLVVGVLVGGLLMLMWAHWDYRDWMRQYAYPIADELGRARAEIERMREAKPS